LLHVKVSELVDNDGRWNWNLLNDWMTVNIVNRINAILPPHVDKGEDIQLGAGTNNSNFSVATIYEILCGFNKLDDEKIWLNI
jgi:hypothetical protein